MLIDFNLPEHLIAQLPTEQRDQCKMLVFNRGTGQITHTTFHELPNLLSPNYFLILNEARVDPTRIFWKDAKGKRQEIVLLKFISEHSNSSQWEAIVSGRNLKVNQAYNIDKDLSFQLLKDREHSIANIEINKSRSHVEAHLQKYGELPIPPYIRARRREEGVDEYTKQDSSDYQTVFGKKAGAVASPTAGLHFTQETFSHLKARNIDWDFVHLSVGWGTFAPLSDHHFQTKKLHSETFSVSSSVAQKIIEKKKQGRKILSVGTTSVRSLETWANHGMSPAGYSGETELFITPGDTFKVSDALLTNFHIPQSSLLLLVAAFLGKDGEKKILDIYNEAITQEYRFYSYGDCMLVL